MDTDVALGKLSYTGIHRASLERFLSMIDEHSSRHPDSTIKRKIINAFLIHLVGKLNSLYAKVLDFEFPQNLNTQVSLADKRHSNLSCDDLSGLYAKYPELDRLSKIMIEQESNNFLLVLHALSFDQSRLRAARFLTQAALQSITHAFVLNGESHDGGRNVILFMWVGLPGLR